MKRARTSRQVSQAAVTLPVDWSGLYNLREVIGTLNDAGSPPGYDGKGYGLYQVYGRHVLGDRNAQLYVGEATDQTFGQRFRQHKQWLVNEYPRIRVFVGRVFDKLRHTATDEWMGWRRDVLLAERELIYTYSPHYNSSAITDPPFLNGYT